VYAPCHHHEDGVLLVEGRIPAGEIQKLREMGHEMEVPEPGTVRSYGSRKFRH